MALFFDLKVSVWPDRWLCCQSLLKSLDYQVFSLISWLPCY